MNKNVLEYGIRRALCMAAFDVKGGDDVVAMYLKLTGMDSGLSTSEVGTIDGFELSNENYPTLNTIFKRFNYDRKFIRHMTNALWRDYKSETGYKKPLIQLEYEKDYEEAMEWLSDEDRLISVAIRSILKISEETDAIAFLNDLLKLDGGLPKGIEDMQHCHCDYKHSKDLIKRFDESFFLIHSLRYDLARSFVTPN